MNFLAVARSRNGSLIAHHPARNGKVSTLHRLRANLRIGITIVGRVG